MKHRFPVSKNSFVKYFTKILLIQTGLNGSVDKQTIGFQERHGDKQKMKLKREGNGFIADYWCDNGFMYSFYFRNMPPPKNAYNLNLVHFIAEYSASLIHCPIKTTNVG